MWLLTTTLNKIEKEKQISENYEKPLQIEDFNRALRF